jgi:hypothetical protein
MQTTGSARYIVGYEIGFEGEINWEKPVVFDLATIDRIYKTESGKARFSISGSVVDPVEFVTKSSFEQVVERLGAIH